MPGPTPLAQRYLSVGACGHSAKLRRFNAVHGRWVVSSSLGSPSHVRTGSPNPNQKLDFFLKRESGNFKLQSAFNFDAICGRGRRLTGGRVMRVLRLRGEFPRN